MEWALFVCYSWFPLRLLVLALVVIFVSVIILHKTNWKFNGRDKFVSRRQHHRMRGSGRLVQFLFDAVLDACCRFAADSSLSEKSNLL